METTEELQQNEITAVKSIYAEDYIETPPPKAWKVHHNPLSSKVVADLHYHRAQHDLQNLLSELPIPIQNMRNEFISIYT